MISLNGITGLALLLGGLRHHEQSYNLQGAVAYLAVIVPLSTIALILPDFTRSTADQTLSEGQAVSFALFTVLLYGVFLAVQTGRHRDFFVEPGLIAEGAPAAHGERRPQRSAARLAGHTAMLLATLVPILLLAKPLAKLIDYGIGALGAPPALGGVLIALVVFTPEGMAALRAALANQLQRSVNLCLGAAASTIGLTVPAVLAVGLITGQKVVLGIDPAGIVLLAVTLALSIITFCGSRTTVLEGAVHLVMFLVYLVLIFSP
jgi:Ca2+:H+ antiporter